jgi:hypothetical protein
VSPTTTKAGITNGFADVESLHPATIAPATNARIARDLPRLIRSRLMPAQ